MSAPYPFPAHVALSRGARLTDNATHDFLAVDRFRSAAGRGFDLCLSPVTVQAPSSSGTDGRNIEGLTLVAFCHIFSHVFAAIGLGGKAF